MADLVKVTIDGRETLVPRGTLIVEAAKQVGVEIPVFCYHEKMHPVGACRMCLVEIEKNPKLQAACTTPVADGMVVLTDTPMVRKGRTGVVEFLLTNHPLDCPVCDKGGECPLQDTTFKYGCDRSRFTEEKRHFQKPVRLSELIVLDRERCIMCTRCVRFQREVAGDEALTLVNRGAGSEVGVLPGRSFDSPFSGNTIELCPVGALTSARFRFRARSWEMDKTASICTLCSVGCNINVETRAGAVHRLTSRENPGVDDGWLCDRGRFTYEFVNAPERLMGPLVRKDGALVPVTWEEALDTVAQGLRGAVDLAGSEAVGGLISAGSTNEELYLFQKLFRVVLASNNVDHGPHGDYASPEIGPDAASGRLEDLESAKVILLVGADPLDEQPVLDLRLKKAVGKRGARLVSLSSRETDLTRLSDPWLQVSPGTEAAVVNGILQQLLSGALPRETTLERLGNRYEVVTAAASEYPLERAAEIGGVAPESITEIAQLLAGTSDVALLFPRSLSGDGDGLRDACGRLALLLGALAGQGGGLYPLGREGNSQGAIDMGALPGLLPGQRAFESASLDHLQESWGVRPPKAAGLSGGQMIEAAADGRLKALYLVGLDPAGEGGVAEIATVLSRVEHLVVQDLFMTATARLAEVVLPAASFAEKDGTLTNLDRRVQRLRSALPPPGQLRPDWETMVSVANALGANWTYADVAEVFGEIVATAPLYEGLRFDGLGDQGQRWRHPVARETEESGNGRGRRLWYQPLQIDGSGA